MTTKAGRTADHSARSRTVPIGDNAQVALGLLRQACTCARDAGVDLWDFALEIGKLFETGLTISDLRWLVAKQFAVHGQESSVYGDSHRSFCGGAGFFFDRTTILSAFEEDAWPDHIDDPLPVKGGIDPATRLHDAINRLNGCQSQRLIRFSGNGTGTGVSWKLRQTD